MKNRNLLVIVGTSYGDEDGCGICVYKMTEENFTELEIWLCRMSKNFKVAEALAREELGFDPEQGSDAIFDHFHDNSLVPTHYVTVEGHYGSYVSFYVNEVKKI